MTVTAELLVEAAVHAAAGRYAGLAVGAIAGDETVVSCAGSTGPGAGPPSGRSLFQIGSVTKVLTALALADAVVRRELTLDTPLHELLPGVPGHRSLAPITLAQLASHTAGLPRLPPGLLRQSLRSRDDPYGSFTTDDLLAALAATRRRRPGGRPRYSNFGAALLGEALSRSSGLPYGRLVTERVSQPLGLADTVVDVRDDQRPRRVVGHVRRGRPTRDWTLPSMPGAGALWSTVDDLLVLLRAHLHPPADRTGAAIRLAMEPRAASGRHHVGLGWHLSPLPGTPHRAVWHDGGTGGFTSYVACVPAASAAVVVLTNTARWVDPIGRDLLPRLARLDR